MKGSFKGNSWWIKKKLKVGGQWLRLDGEGPWIV